MASSRASVWNVKCEDVSQFSATIWLLCIKNKKQKQKKHQQISIQRFQASEGKEGMEGIGGIEFFT